MLKEAVTIAKLRKNGIKYPIITYQEAKRAGISLAALCAVLEQETGGGRNVYGHDPDPRTGRPAWHGHSGTVKVTRDNYHSYLAWRRGNHNKYMQGVGPLQLTWYSYQDKADRYGGCWQPRYNIRVGIEILLSHYHSTRSWEKAFTEYNGSAAYGKVVKQRMNKWSKILG